MKAEVKREVSVVEIELGSISPCPYKPRESFDSASLISLAKSIASVGIIEPLVVRNREFSDDKQGYELVCGERRLRAAKIAGLRTVPCIISEQSDSGCAILALTENLQRQDLNIFEQARAIRMLTDIFSIDRQFAALSLGLSQSDISESLKLLSLSQSEQEAFLSNNLTLSHAEALLSAEPCDRKKVLTEICKRHLSAEETCAYILSLNEKKRRKETTCAAPQRLPTAACFSTQLKRLSTSFALQE